MDALDKMVVVCGPTATGKTGLAVQLARRFGGEVVGADSMQVYSGLVVGTAAPTAEELGGTPYHLTGFVPPQRPFSVADWLEAARGALAGIAGRGALPIVCGGTGLYLQSLVKGTAFPQEKADPALRQRLEQEWDENGGEAMYIHLATMDAERAAQLHPNDKKRILRALEQSLATGTTARQRAVASSGAPAARSTLVIGLDYPEREVLYQKINARVDAMMAAGLPDEARLVWEHRDTYKTAAQAIGYKEFFPCFEGATPLEDCVERLKQATRNYAKRQLTWFRHMAGVCWLDAAAKDLPRQATELVEVFLKDEQSTGGGR